MTARPARTEAVEYYFTYIDQVALAIFEMCSPIS
jgi:hypothetical protein